jgi:hypothetical protein
MKQILRNQRHWLFFLLPAIFFCSTAYFSNAQIIDFGKSYINVTKGLNGGTVETGDVLEIRASVVVRSGTYDSCSYTDVIPAGTVFIPGTIRVLTNEGKIYQQFTDTEFDDCGWVTGSAIRINLGFTPGAAPATYYRRGRVANTHKPSFYGSSCIMIASFRVTVTATLGSDISSGGGAVTYKRGSSPLSTYTFPANLIRVYQNFGICANSVGTNALGTEVNGTFGAGRPRNRGASGNVPTGYSYNVFTANGPNDYSYGVANNTSTMGGFAVHNNWPKPDPDPDGAGPNTTHRVFSVWDIIGDHTGAASPILGNPPADTIGNANAGYMLIINAAYRIDSAFQQTISGLCPNTYYEISCWMRNICSKCGCDSNGKGASNSSGPVYYIPTAAADSSGVYPNVTFDIDGIDYYSTGNLLYTGEWVKKGFTFLTGPAQTSFTLKFFNNAPGGGGNDWALDDISVATCSPNMKYSPSANPDICEGNPLVLYDTVRSYFNNYTYYKWQRSTDNGSSWTDVTAPSGPSSPYWNGADWEYVSTYTVPPWNTTLADSADQYRLVVATTLSNLSDPDCRFTDAGNIITMHVIDCGIPLDVSLFSFTGRLMNTNALLNWTTGRETEPFVYTIERSDNGAGFQPAGWVNSHTNPASETNHYTFTDAGISGINYYRIRISKTNGEFFYSKIIRLSPDPKAFSFIAVINPFDKELSYSISTQKNSKAEALLINAAGSIVQRSAISLVEGTNYFSFANTTRLCAGIYILKVMTTEGESIQQLVLKRNN